ncbi:MAG TPA: twin-arginine translocase TatA/TatE family subunit [Pyrinomonadaceae bacterium]|nr:twin-arginine translocase TatA/TatE family subunit [Pyrinomonadaceae bacterium]
MEVETGAVLALILDSLGSTELLFILVIALIFFGPRKLPQLARSMGKSMAEFRKASEDFKRTWEREVALETARSEAAENSILPEASTPTYAESHRQEEEPALEPIPAELAVARGSHENVPVEATTARETETTPAQNSPKHDWL